MHGGVCVDGIFSYICDCQSTGWDGERCEIGEIDLLVSNEIILLNCNIVLPGII